jgi:hypothetical protein
LLVFSDIFFFIALFVRSMAQKMEEAMKTMPKLADSQSSLFHIFVWWMAQKMEEVCE